ncbi:hypothetical protein AAHC03_016653 [Spirometra sp. Aus1]
MASRNWSRGGPGYGGGYMGSNSANIPGSMGFYASPMDRRSMYNTSPMGKPDSWGVGYRDDPYRRPRDDYRGGKRPKGKSPMGEKRPHHDNFGPRKDNRPVKRPQSSSHYEVKVPRMPLNIKSATFPEAKLLHPHLSIPGDFSKACFSWQDAFPMHEPMKLGTKTDIYIVHRDVESHVTHPPNAFDAPDADYSYSVRVMLMASPELAELYKSTCRTADEPYNAEKTAATKNIYFLVGGRTKTETMGIGGPWSPSLDGENPDTNPQTLINTSVRTFKAFTGIDLSSVTEWTRFMEIRYYRCANSKAPTLTEDEEERDILEDRQEVVVFMIPNVSHLMPPDCEWEKTKQLYAESLQKLLASPEPEKTEAPTKEEPEAEVSQTVDTTLDESQEIGVSADGEPTHYSKLDVNVMKVTELRAELAARKLDIKGVKANLLARLQTALEEEKKADVGEPRPEETPKTAEDTPTKPAAPSGQPKEEPKEISEKDRRRLERLYRLGDKPAILVFPNRAARGGRFDCHRVSLHSLLNYQSGEQKEHNFEVSLFAEQFHEMLQRDCAFTIFKAIYSAPEKDPKEAKPEQNGVSRDGSDEPESKRRRNESESSQTNDDETGKARRLRRTVDPKLLFSFIYFDIGHSGFIRDYDLVDILHLLNLAYSKAQMKKLVAKVTTRRDHVQYRNLTDKDIVEGDGNDVISLKLEENDPEFLRDLAAGNDLLFGGDKPQVPAKAVVVGSDGDAQLIQRVHAAEEIKRSTEFQFFQIKDELEKTRAKLNSCKDTEEKLRGENRDLQNRLKEEQKSSRDNKVLVGTYNHLLKHSRDMMSNAVTEIDKQFEKEKAKREAEKAAAEAEKAKAEAEKAGDGKTDEPEGEKSEEKEWEVVDQV